MNPDHLGPDHLGSDDVDSPPTRSCDGMGPDPFHTDYVPINFSGVLVEGPRWAKALAAIGTLLAPLARLLDRGLVVLVWGTLVVVGGAVLTGHATTIGLSDTAGGGYRPIHYVAVAIALVVLAVVIWDVIGFGQLNKATARADQARYATRTRVAPIVLPHPEPAHTHTRVTASDGAPGDALDAELRALLDDHTRPDQAPDNPPGSLSPRDAA